MRAGADAIVKTIVIDAPPDHVFDFIVHPANIVRWLGIGVEFDAVPGGVVRIDPNGRDVIRGTVVEVVRPSRVVFTWGWEASGHPVPPGSTIVEISLQPEGAGTRLTLVHSALAPDMRDKHDLGWTHYLARLKTVAEGRDSGPDPFSNPDFRHG